MSNKISVILPAYNEAPRIENCIRETIQALAGHNFEIIVVDDGSQDNTRAAALAAAAETPCVQVLGYAENRGKGYALKYGFEHSNGDFVAFLDADMQIHPRQLLTLYQEMQARNANVVIGCKRYTESHVEYSPFRAFISVGYLWLVRLLFGLSLRDTQTGVKLFRREVLEQVWPRVSVKRFAFDLGLLVGALRFNYSIVEAPVDIVAIKDKPDRTSLRTLLRTFLDTLVIYYEFSFWKWLNPGLGVKAWMVIFVLGLGSFSFGAAHILTFIHLSDPLAQVAYYAALRFLNPLVRDWLLVLLGIAAVVAALIQLNKYILAAFARTDPSRLTSASPALPTQEAAPSPPDESPPQEP